MLQKMPVLMPLEFVQPLNIYRKSATLKMLQLSWEYLYKQRKILRTHGLSSFPAEIINRVEVIPVHGHPSIVQQIQTININLKSKSTSSFIVISVALSSHSLIRAGAGTFSRQSIPTGVLCCCVSCLIIVLIAEFPQQRGQIGRAHV